MSNTAIEQLQKLLQLIRIEREDEENRYREIIQKKSTHERRMAGLCWHPARISDTDYGIGGLTILTIERVSGKPIPHKFQQGQTAMLYNPDEGDGQNLRGVVQRVRRSANSLELALELDALPDWADTDRLALDVLYNETTFNAMESALQSLIAAKNDRLSELRDIIYGYSQARFEQGAAQVSLPQLNESQHKAVQLIANANDVALVHGPPGTGKTTVLVHAIVNTLKTQKQVLVCAPSNAAADLLTEKLTHRGVEVLRMGHPARINEELQIHTLDSKASQHHDYKRVKQLRKEGAKLKRQAKKFKRVFGAKERDERRELYQAARDMFADARNTERYILSSVLNNAQVITATLVGSTHPSLEGKTFETVFIDEAAQALAPACWIPILKARRVVFAGDHCQLPPVVKSSEALKGGLEVSLFEKCMKQPQLSIMLNTQYRMNRQIMGFSNAEFYAGNLVAHESVSEHLLPTQDSAFDFIDTAGCGFSESQDPQSLSTKNEGEADLLLRYLNQMYDQWQISSQSPDGLKSPPSLGIIAPYKAQVLYLQDELPNYNALLQNTSNISINTVDGFQGQERDMIAISLTRSNEEGKIGFLKDYRRMNVALTRARKKLVVVGDSATIASDAFYQRFLDYADQCLAYKTAWEFV